MKQIIPYVPTYLPNSDTLLADLKNITDLLPHAKIFTADAVSMYTNIDTDTGINAFSKWLHIYSHKLLPVFPCQLFLQILNFVMWNNIFQFNNTYWLQTKGTTMGTPAACMYATILFGLHEHLNILPKFAANIRYYKRYIVDIFTIWIPPIPSDNDRTWTEFKTTLDEFGSIRWKPETPTDHITFLDLNLTLSNGQISSATNQKPMNLYLYLPPLSAHPTSCLKASSLGRYWKQNNMENLI